MWRCSVPEPGLRERLSIRSHPLRFRDARRWLSEIAHRAGFGETRARQMALALSEVCANAHRHAYGGRTDGRIDLHLEVGQEALRLTVRDYGTTFVPTDYEAPPPEELADGGYGLPLIKTMVDRVDYTDMGDGMRVVLVKKRAPR